MKIELSVALPLQSLFGWFMFWWPDQGPIVQNVLWNIFCDFGFKIHPVDRIFFASRKNISCMLCTPKINFLNALNRICLSSKYIQVI